MPRLLKKNLSPAPPPPRVPCVGRAHELHEFRRSVRLVLGCEEDSPSDTSPYPHIFFVHGEDGMGKTTLLRQFLASALEDGFPTNRCVQVNLSTSSLPTPDSLAAQLAETLCHYQGKCDQYYQQACTQRDSVAPYVKELQQQWARWVALRTHETSDLETVIHTRYNAARLPAARRAGFARLHEPGHIEIQTAWATEGLAALITFRNQHGRLPTTFEELLHNELGNQALLFLPNGGTLAALAEDVAILAEAAPLLLLLDNYDLAHAHDESFCTSFLSRSSARMLTVIAGRHPPHPVYYNLFGSGHAQLLHTYQLSAFQASEVYHFLQARLYPGSIPSVPPPTATATATTTTTNPLLPTPHGHEHEHDLAPMPLSFQPPAVVGDVGLSSSMPSIDQGMVADIFALSRGIPLALAILGDYVATHGTIYPFAINTPIPHGHDNPMRVCTLVQQFLSLIQADATTTTPITFQQRSQHQLLAIRVLAILLRPDEEMVCACWGLAHKHAQHLAHHLANSYPALFAGSSNIYELHTLVYRCIRYDTHTAKYRADDWHMLKAGLVQVLPIIRKRLKQYQRACKSEHERYHHPAWCATILDLLNLCFWLNEEEEARTLLLNHWIGARASNPFFAERLAALAVELAPRTPEWRRITWAMQEDDLTMVEPFIATLDTHAQIMLFSLQAQQVALWYVEDDTDLKRINQHIMLLERGYALDRTWQPIMQSLMKAYATRGRYFFQQKEYQAALEDFTHCLKLDPNQPAILASRAAIKHYLGDDADALADYNRSLALRPNDPITLTNRGVINYYRGDYRGALADNNRSLELRPHHPITLYNRGVVRRITGDLTGALADFDHALQAQPDDPDTLNSRGVVKQSLGDHTGALADFDYALHLRPDDADVLYNRGVVKEYLGHYTAALNDFDRSLTLRPYDPATLDNRGVAKAHIGDYEGALKDYDRSLVLRPDHPVTLENRGVAKAYLGYYDAALKDYQRAMELHPEDPSPLYNIACLYALQHKVEDALDWLERTVARNPSWRTKAQHDPDFAALHNNPHFQALLSGTER